MKTYLNVAKKEEKEGEIVRQAQRAIRKEIKTKKQLKNEIENEKIIQLEVE